VASVTSLLQYEAFDTNINMYQAECSKRRRRRGFLVSTEDNRSKTLVNLSIYIIGRDGS